MFSPPLTVVRSLDAGGVVTAVAEVDPVEAVHDAASYVRALDRHSEAAAP